MADDEPPPISDGTPSPRNVEELEALIKRFYTPNPPSLLSSIEKHLQWHQRSESAWNIAASLLQSNDGTVRFFGALTLTVKLNTSGQNLEEQSIQELLQRLIGWYAENHRTGTDAMASRKLASSLAVLCLQPHAPPTGCLARVAAGLAGTALPSTTKSPTEIPLSESLNRIGDDERRLLALLEFAVTFAEEATKRRHDGNQRLVAVYQAHVVANITDASQLIQYCLSYPGSDVNPVRSVATYCLTAWALFCLKATSIDLNEVGKLRTLIRPALQWVAEADTLAPTRIPGISSPVESISDLINQYPAFFQASHLRDVSELIRSETVREALQLAADGDEESLPFVRLLCAYADADMAHIVEGVDDVAAREIFEMLHSFIRQPEYPYEDRGIVEVLGLWNAIVEYIIDTCYETPDQPAPLWHDYAKAHVVRMVEEFWMKIQWPIAEVYSEWDNEDKKWFQQFRVDVRDLLQTAHLALTTQLLQAFVKMIMGALDTRNWIELEAALFCLDGIAESLDESDREDALTAQVVNSSLYPLLTNSDSQIPLYVRRTAMRLIGSLGSYFERRPESLPNALNYLFTSIETPSMADAAAKSIHNLCTGCRHSLTPHLGAFLQQFERFSGSAAANMFTTQKVIGAVAAIAQALPNDQAKRDGLSAILDFVERDVKRSLEHMAAGNHAESYVEAQSAMICLASVAKSFQETVEIVDLDGSATTESYWTRDEGSAVQQRIVRLLTSVLEIFPNEVSILDAVCDTLKAGFTETSPGPFVLLPETIASFLLRPQPDSPQLSILLSTACGFIRAFTPSMTPNIHTEAVALLSHVSRIMYSLGEPRNDPELAQTLIEVLVRYMPRYTEELVGLRPALALETVMNFTIACIRAPEPLPKRAAAAFWSAMLSITAQPEPLQEILDEIAAHFGPRLALAFAGEIGGNAMRSDLEILADPIRKLFSRTPRSKSWFEAALTAPADDSLAAQEQPDGGRGLQLAASTPQAAKTRFLSGLGVARDLPTVRKVVLEFAQACKAVPAAPKGVDVVEMVG